MKRTVLWIGGAVALVGLAIAGWLTWRPKEEAAPSGGVATARKGDYRITVTEEGTFQARKSVNLLVATQAFHQQMTIRKIVDEGTTVQKDETLIELDTSEIDRMIAQTEVELQAAKNDVVQASEELRVRKLQNSLDLQRADDRVKATQMECEKWEALEKPRRVTEAQIRIEDSNQAVTDQENEVKHLKKMLEKDFISKVDVEKAETALKKAKINAQLAENAMKLLVTYDNPRETARLKALLKDDEMFQAGQVVAVNSATNQKESALLRAQTALRNKEDQLKKLQADKGAMTVKAPNEGIVLYGDPRQRMYMGGQNQELKVGGKIHPHNPLLTIPDLSAYKVNLQVNEGDVNKVSPGLIAQIRPEAIPNTTFTGKVSRVSRVSGQQQWWAGDGGGSKFDVEIETDGADARIRPGMKCKVEILIEEVKGVVFVPIDAIFEKDGKTLCYVVSSPPVAREVKPGRANQDVIEILEGLKEGERVTLFDPARGVTK